METWVVLVEAATTIPDARVDAGAVRLLLTRFGEECPLGLYAPDRYALQVWTPAERAEQALADVIERWRVAASEVGLGRCNFVRAEVMTDGELNAEVGARSALVALPDGPSRLHALPAVHETTRALLQVETAAEAARVVVGLVYRLGGFIVLTEAGNPYLLPLDLSFGDGPAISPAAFPHTNAKLLLEQLLPEVLEDARRVLEARGVHPRVGRVLRHRADVSLASDWAVDSERVRGG